MIVQRLYTIFIASLFKPCKIKFVGVPLLRYKVLPTTKVNCPYFNSSANLSPLFIANLDKAFHYSQENKSSIKGNNVIFRETNYFFQ